jgi:DNA-binding beta-propeller fold protein YncE
VKAHLVTIRKLRIQPFSTLSQRIPGVAAACWLLIGEHFSVAQQFHQSQVNPPRAPSLELPGERTDGSVLLPNQWSLRPAGRQVPLGDLPVNIAFHPSGRFAAILHSGHARHEVAILDLKTEKIVSRTQVPETFYGLEFSRNGKRLYCSGASDEVIHVFDFKEGVVTANSDIRLREARQRGIPCGLALSRDGRTLYAANVWGQMVSKIDLARGVKLADIELSMSAGDSTKEPATFENRGPVDPDLAAITKRAQAPLDPASPDSPFPYACRLDEKRQRLYVSLWAQSCVAVIDLKSGLVVERWPTGQHPNEMLLTKSSRYLLVANANHNTVTILDTASGKAVETLVASLSPDALPGSTPNSLALSRDETKLFVANACNNNIAVFDVTVIGKSRSLGFIPVGWYPTSVRITPDGKRLLVTNGKGLISKPNPRGPQPGNKEEGRQLIKELFPGTLSIIDLPKESEFTSQLAAYTAQAYQCSPRTTTQREAETAMTAGNPVPLRGELPSPIKYCIYIVKENRTYDQVLGDIPEGNGDPSLCLFPEKVTPNQHKLAREFVLLDNFYVDAEVSADGHEWSMGAYATDFVEKTWPLSYGHNRSGKYPFPAEGNFPIASPANGYLWDRARLARVSYRSYGEFVQGAGTSKQPNRSRVASLEDHYDPQYRPFDLNYPDVKRAERLIEELKRFESEGKMPQLQIVRLGNDHTAGTLPGRLTPNACVADNDRALGMIVEAVSHSKFWPNTAIFVLEDDAQNGPDHVDAHRSIAFVASPYARRGAVDSSMYSTSSMLRTIELILGLQPMSQFDSAAAPMFHSFQSTPDLRPFDSLPANVNLNEKNTLLSWGSRASQKMDFSKEDAADDLQLNEIIWRAVRGADHPMPAPIHAAFVYAHKQADEDD